MSNDTKWRETGDRASRGLARAVLQATLLGALLVGGAAGPRVARAAPSASTSASTSDAGAPAKPMFAVDERAFEADARRFFEEARERSRTRYERELDALHRTRAERKRESLDTTRRKHERLVGNAGFTDELRAHAERMARLRRMGGLVVAEQRGTTVRDRVTGLIFFEIDRHDAAIRALEATTTSTR